MIEGNRSTAAVHKIHFIRPIRGAALATLNARLAANLYAERYPDRRHPKYEAIERLDSAYRKGRIPGTRGSQSGRPRTIEDDVVLQEREEDPSTSKMLSRDKLMRRKVGGRAYKCYSERQLELCLSDITNKILTQREAAEKYKIPRSSIILKLKAIRTNKVRQPGHQRIFSDTEETAFIQHAIEMCHYGFPTIVFD
ncbi:unnamed protein product [Parnassius apollo]|uniref:(apollo) hypothetical protein n=1 Tax=Parnassius apollo TaxID=110799 RepID=A0A8S3X932_PARAO|nr:unnamed protein product [Parnassius apollo]